MPEPEALKTEVVHVPRPVGAIMRTTVTFAQVIEAKKERDELIKQAFTEDVHFGVIPGTKKNSLYQAGAAAATAWYNCYPEYKILSGAHDPDRVNEFFGWDWRWSEEKGKNVRSQSKVKQTSVGFHCYEMECRLIDRASGLVVGTGVGACSTSEEKYVSRPNDLQNTILKMAKKRAFVDAALITYGLGDLFTQDLEDMPRDVLTTNADKKREAAKPQKSAPLPPREPVDFSKLTEKKLVTIQTHSGTTYVWTVAGSHWGKDDLEKLGFRESAQGSGQFGSAASKEIRDALMSMAFDTAEAA